MEQLILFDSIQSVRELKTFIVDILNDGQRPSPLELLMMVEETLGLRARWHLKSAILELAADSNFTKADRAYLMSMIEDGSLEDALRGGNVPDPSALSTIDALLRQGLVYQSSEAFREMIEFMGRFRDYAPFNNMLVKVQNPSCGFYAREKDWMERFGRKLKEDARPMLILAPMHPVMLVYDLDQTEGGKLPDALNGFAKFTGDWSPVWLKRSLENAERQRIRVDFKTLSSTHGGFATFARGTGDWKMRIGIHDGLDEPSRFGVLCHELAHIFLGHLGGDKDHWWPSRMNLDHKTVEIEAEAVAYIVTNRFGLEGGSAAYVSHHLKDAKIPSSVSMDLIAKVAGKVERMALEMLPAPRPKKRRGADRSF